MSTLGTFHNRGGVVFTGTLASIGAEAKNPRGIRGVMTARVGGTRASSALAPCKSNRSLMAGVGRAGAARDWHWYRGDL